LKKIAIIGGGLAGLVSANILSRKGLDVHVIEKKIYPFHRVCGEYISNETIPFLKSLDLFPEEFFPPSIRNFLLSAVSGKYEKLPLDLGGFGVSRYIFDEFLFKKAQASGAEFWLNTEAENIVFHDRANKFEVTTSRGNIIADVVIGSFGKRSKLDVQLNRSFIQKRSPYVGIKYHIKSDHPADLIALHNFPGGYCGMSNVENDKTNLCYLTHRDNVRKYKNIRDMEEAVLFINPLLKHVFANADFLFEKPEVINEISFETKSPVEDHILMAGDAAGMITPLCGNGMAMAIHAAKIASELVTEYCTTNSLTREQLEKAYTHRWEKTFATRLWAGRQIQNLFGNEWASNIAINLAIHVKPVAQIIMRNTHGKVF
jgi:menaquinone-9 beta-reductase